MSNGGNLTLSGRRAVVTGAGRGIGRSIALTLALAGADVAVTARTATELEQLVTQIQAMGRRSLAISCDVTDTEQVQRMAKTAVEGLGGIDILVNNAGNAGSHKFLNHPDDLWHRMLIEPEEVAAIAVFLAQDISKGITGQAINIDGGGVMS